MYIHFLIVQETNLYQNYLDLHVLFIYLFLVGVGERGERISLLCLKYFFSSPEPNAHR